MKPVCTTCNDTHRMSLGEDREVMCTFCPVPCQACRVGGNGPYCTTTPCPCKCHRKHGARTSEIDLNDARARLRSMAAGSETWDLSPNDRSSIGVVLAELARLEHLLENTAPSAPLIPQSRAEEMVAEERERCALVAEEYHCADNWCGEKIGERIRARKANR